MNSEQAIKYASATDVLRGCLGRRGVRASASGAEKYVYRTRHLPLVREALGHLGHRVDVGAHLGELVRRQGSDGRVPSAFYDGLFGAVAHLWGGVRHRGPIAALREALAAPCRKRIGDEELHFAVAALEHARWLGAQVGATADDLERATTLREAAGAALDYVWDCVVDEEELPVGANGRRSLRDACLLHQALRLWGSHAEAAALRETVRRTFRHPFGELMGWADDARVDPLGSSLALLYGVVGYDAHAAVLLALRSLDGPHGVVDLLRDVTEQSDAGDPDTRVVWPVAVAGAVRAAVQVSRTTYVTTGPDDGSAVRALAFARAEFDKFTHLRGHGEWYDAANGESRGAEECAASAAAYVVAAHALGVV